MKTSARKAFGAVFPAVFAFTAGALFIRLLGYDPGNAYKELFKGAFLTRLNLGTTIEKFCPIFLTGAAYCVTIQAKYFNLGVEGCLYVGALASAAAGFIPGLPKPVHLPLALACGVAAGVFWALIPGYLRTYHEVNEACTSIMFNYIGKLFTTFMILNVWPAATGYPQTKPIEDSARFTRIFAPSRVNTGIFLTAAVYLFAIWLIHKSRFGFKLCSIGTNRLFSEYVGFHVKRTVLAACCIAGAMGGMAGGIETMGVYYSVWDGFSLNLAFDGLLASVIAKNDIKKLPFAAFMLAVLKSGALGMERNTNIPKSIIDALIPVLVILLTMEGLLDFGRRRKEERR